VTGLGIVVGNPKPQSRTLTVARAVARASAEACGLEAGDAVEVDLATLAPQLFSQA
jgi:hypothetical protein